jgi:hypothetical protein
MENILQTTEEYSLLVHAEKLIREGFDRLNIVNKISANETIIIENTLGSIANNSKLDTDLSKYHLASNIVGFPDLKFVLHCIACAILIGDSDFTDERNLLDDRKLNFLKGQYIESEISANFIIKVVQSMKNLVIALIEDDNSSNEVAVYFDRVVNSFEPKVKPFWERLVEIGRQVPDEEWAKLPTDFSRNFEHYMYGAEKEE